MNRRELKQYIRQHPSDEAAIQELFVERQNPDASWYPSPCDSQEAKAETERALRHKIAEAQN
ncbi:MAG: hypothetical protein BRC58_02970 [Cyanobacteria bacterium QS_8_64_29]|nr:MAG: hypothetical protein BRC58_02970 [Cyanobacteria bacterium QS_8_64_29]